MDRGRNQLAASTDAVRGGAANRAFDKNGALEAAAIASSATMTEWRPVKDGRDWVGDQIRPIAIIFARFSRRPTVCFRHMLGSSSNGMNSRPISVFLLALNLGLVGTIAYMAWV